MSVCVIGHITVKDPGKWNEYRSKVPHTLVQWGGEVIFRGRKVEVFSGEHPHTDTVMIGFPTPAPLQAGTVPQLTRRLFRFESRLPAWCWSVSNRDPQPGRSEQNFPAAIVFFS